MPHTDADPAALTTVPDQADAPEEEPALPDGRAPEWLTGADVDELFRYVTYALIVLRLQHWTIVLSASPTDEDDHVADIEPTDGRRIALLRTHKSWTRVGLRERAHTIFHELIHLHHRDVEAVARAAVYNDGIPRTVSAVLHAQLREQFEQMTDTLSDAFLPLVEAWPGPIASEDVDGVRLSTWAV